MRHRMTGCAVALAVVAWSVQAQEVTGGSQANPPAQQLAERSVECLIRGEDAESPGAQRVAYREGLELAARAVAADDANADAHFALFANQGRLALLEHGTANPFALLSLRRHLDRALALCPESLEAP